ncbi:Pre-mRNA splicing Prp18-interacting factor-domain-containing protein [Chytridium lagenaria]|nr:Pre-mRNA splicing Prp18-interacting factor-domain-containing protein [Chytridium lagenaria]
MASGSNLVPLTDGLTTGKLSREDFKRQKAIEEQRKAGTLPAERHQPHIPHYISQAPWYLDINHPTLKHQRNPGEVDNLGAMDEWYQRGKFKGPAAKKYRKGACENCGAMTHKTKDCLDRPRQKGAKHTNRNIAPDEILMDVKLGFEAKRDRWNGYDPNDYLKIVEEGEAIEQERRRIREQKAREKLEEAAKPKAEKEVTEEAATGEPAKAEDSDSDGEEDDEKYADAAEAVGQKLDGEDTYYYPFMRDNPLKDKEGEEANYAGDNFVRWTGDAPGLAKLQVFAWQAADRGKDVHLNANPTQGELLFKEYQKKKEMVTETQKGSILEKYGGDEYLKAPPKELLMAQTESYVEYSQTGKVIKGQEKIKVRSKYEEDVYLLNHTSVWGSFWRDGRWGYACCHAVSPVAYCTGQAGIDASLASNLLLSSAPPTQAEPASLLASHIQKAAKGISTSTTSAAGDRKKGRLGEGDVVIDEEKLKKAIEGEKERKRKEREDEGNRKGKKGKYSGGVDREITEEELEAYRMTKTIWRTQWQIIKIAMPKIEFWRSLPATCSVLLIFIWGFI